MTPTQHRIMCLLIKRAAPVPSREIAQALGLTKVAAQTQLYLLKLAGHADMAMRGPRATWAPRAEAEKARAEWLRLKASNKAATNRRQYERAVERAELEVRQIWVPQEQWAQRGNHGG